MRELKKRSLWVIVLIIGFAAGACLPIVFNSSIFKSNDSSAATLLQDQLFSLSELSVLKYEYHNVIVSRLDQKISLPGISDISYAETVKLITYSGYLKAGTDLSKATTDYDAVSKTVTVKLPKSQILDNVAETEKAEVEDIKGNIFSKYPTQTVFNEINAEKKKLQEEKIAGGLLEEADKRVRLVLTSFLKSKAYENVVIEFY